MKTDRLNAFTDGVIAIIITIMVLELPVPKGAGMTALKPELTLFAAYALASSRSASTGSSTTICCSPRAGSTAACCSPICSSCSG